MAAEVGSSDSLFAPGERCDSASPWSYALLPLGVSAALILYRTAASLLVQKFDDLLSLCSNLLVGLALTLWVRHRGYDWKALGLGPPRAHDTAFGLLWGLVLLIAIVLTVVVPGQLVNIVDVDHWRNMSWTAFLWQVLLRIPLGTAFFEELSFRGVLYALWTVCLGARWASIVTSVLFGFWHVGPVYQLLRGGPAFDSPLLLSAGVAGGVVATFLGGLLFIWMRRWSGSLCGALITHWLFDVGATIGPFMVTH